MPKTVEKKVNDDNLANTSKFGLCHTAEQNRQKQTSDLNLQVMPVSMTNQ